MGVLANALSNVHSAVLGDFKGAVGRADGVGVEADPRDPEKKVLRFGKGKDDIFPVEGSGRPLKECAKFFQNGSKALRSCKKSAICRLRIVLF